MAHTEISLKHDMTCHLNFWQFGDFFSYSWHSGPLQIQWAWIDFFYDTFTDVIEYRVVHQFFREAKKLS